MKRIVTAVVLIPLVFAIIFFLANWVFVSALAIVGFICTFEYLKLAQKLGTPPVQITLTLVASFFFVLIFRAISYGKSDLLAIVAALMGCIILLMPFFYLARPLASPDLTRSLIGSSLSLLGILYICVPLVCLILIREIHSLGNFFLILLLLAVWSGDIAAMYVGKLIGKHKLAPRISPGKTWEGTVASTIFSILVVSLFTQVLGPKLSGGRTSAYFDSNDFRTMVTLAAPPIWVPICIGLLVNCAAQLGDLAESMLKRTAGVKDSGTLLPGHGGMLDRVDALLFAAPVAMLIFTFTKDLFHATPHLWIIK